MEAAEAAHSAAAHSGVRDNERVSNEIPEPESGTEQVTVRRAPKIQAFLIVGGGIGAIVTLILTSLFPVDPLVGFGPLFAYFSLFGVTGGVLIGAILALIVDRRSKKRTRTGEAEFTTEKRPEPEKRSEPAERPEPPLS